MAQFRYLGGFNPFTLANLNIYPVLGILPNIPRPVIRLLHKPRTPHYHKVHNPHINEGPVGNESDILESTVTPLRAYYGTQIGTHHGTNGAQTNCRVNVRSIPAKRSHSTPPSRPSLVIPNAALYSANHRGAKEEYLEKRYSSLEVSEEAQGRRREKLVEDLPPLTSAWECFKSAYEVYFPRPHSHPEKRRPVP